jgi:hypothetical protein
MKHKIFMLTVAGICCALFVIYARKNRQEPAQTDVNTECTAIILQWQEALTDKLSSFSKKEDKELKANFAQKTNYGYIVAKAARYLVYSKHSIDYGKDDVYNYPMKKEWDMRAVHAACLELTNKVKGLSAKDCFTVSPVAVRELYEMFHFTFTYFESTENSNVIKMYFVHKNTGEKCYAFCACKDTGLLGRHPFYLKVMIPGNSPKEPVFVTVCENETAVKICTENHFQGIAAEYAWAYSKFPGCQKTDQMHGEKSIDGKPVPVDVVWFKLPNGTTKEITFDIADLKMTF